MKRTIYIILIMSLVCSSIIGCSKDTQPEDMPNAYLSFTVNYMASYDAATDYADYGAAVYTYDLQTKEVSEIFNFPLNAMYPLGVYDRKSNSVYYSKEKGNDTYERKGTGDQIYVYNLTTGSDTMLTDDLLAVNHIVPVDGAVFFIAARQNQELDDWPNLVLGKVDLSDGSVKYWDEAKTAQTRLISVDRIEKRVYVAISDSEEEAIAMDTANRAGTAVVPPKHTICSYDYNLSDRREILHKDNLQIKAIYAMDNWLLYRADSTVAPWPGITTLTTSEMLDLDNMDVLFRSEEQFTGYGSFAPDKKGVFVLKNTGEHDGICYYDFETQEYTPIVDGDFGDNYFGVANFQLVYYGLPQNK